MMPLVEIITCLQQQHAASWSLVSNQGVCVCVYLCMCQVATVFPHNPPPAAAHGIDRLFLINFKVERVKFNMEN